jgi:general secretion pathway protein D
MKAHFLSIQPLSSKVQTLRPSWNYAALAAFSLLLSGCASWDHTRAMVDLQMDHPEEALPLLKSASDKAPTDASYKVDYLLKRDEQINDLLSQAADLRAEGKYPQARDLYNRILSFEPKSSKTQGLLRTLSQEARNEKLLTEGEAFLAQSNLERASERAKRVLDDFPNNMRAQALRDSVADLRAANELALTKERAAKDVMSALVTLQFTDATLKQIFEGLAKSIKINFLFDRDVKQDAKVTIYVKDVAVSDAIDLMLMQSQLQKRIVNGNTLLIYPASAAKQAEYEDLEIRTYQITNADIKYLANMLKAMLKLKEISADEKTGILVLRDTPEILRLAERLIAAHEVPDPEIMLEVEVLEVTKSRASNLGLLPPTSISVATPGGASGMTLGALQSLSKDDLIVSPLSATLNFGLTDSDAKLLASPRIRARNKEVAKIMIGDRIPTITNTVTPLTTGSSVVTGNVTYQDVGLKLEFEPRIYADSEIGIKVNLEVSNIAQQFTDSNGGRSYQIGTRNASTNLRLKDGETQILGGLITDNDRNTANKIAGLGHLPIIGALFGNNSGNSDASEIVLAITPHIVRNLAVRATDVKTIFTGTYNSLREKPILSDPGSTLKLAGTLNPTIDGGQGAVSTSGSTANAATGSSILINAATPSTPLSAQGAPHTAATGNGMNNGLNNGQGSGFGTSPAPSPLQPPPPMFSRP